MKFLSILASLIALSSVSAVTTKFWGSLTLPAKPVYDEVKEVAAIDGQVVSGQVTYIADAPITGIRVIDLSTDGFGARFRMNGGGVGAQHVTVGFTSLEGHGINYQVQVYIQ